MAELHAALNPKAIQEGQKNCKDLLEKHYYQAWDCGVGEARLETRHNRTSGVEEKRSKLFFLYKQGAEIVWNGNRIEVPQVDRLVEMMLNVKTKHTLRTLDVQPIVDDSHFLCTATGSCRYDNEMTRGFTQMFMVWKDKPADDTKQSTFWIIHDNFRWTKADE
eukprot:Rhum_TRINITY_DN22140_c0_g1::Rhum_TRINITY_DN22140_c0_g1_i1::g.175298::m.175298/K14285/NXT1_2, P15; NTF2-related export protein 1/2